MCLADRGRSYRNSSVVHQRPRSVQQYLQRRAIKKYTSAPNTSSETTTTIRPSSPLLGVPSFPDPHIRQRSLPAGMRLRHFGHLTNPSDSFPFCIESSLIVRFSFLSGRAWSTRDRQMHLSKFVRPFSELPTQPGNSSLQNKSDKE